MGAIRRVRCVRGVGAVAVERGTGRGAPLGAGEALWLALAGIGVLIGAVLWVGGWLAAGLAGGRVSGDVGALPEVAVGLLGDPGDPSAAWGDRAVGMPAAGLYWVCTAGVAVVVGACASAVVWWWRRSSVGGTVRLGVGSEARLARRRDMAPLVVRSTVPPKGRMLLGRLARGGALLATEDRGRYPMRGRGEAARRQGDRGSVAVLGPTRSGKTVLLTTGMVGWDGPVVCLGVKRDLYDATSAARARRGELAVFDPGGSTGLPTARWTPLRGVTTASGARRAGRALAQAIPTTGVQGGDYWAQQGMRFITGYVALAGLSELLAASGDGPAGQPLTIQRLAAWVHLGVGITDPLVNALIRTGLSDGQPLEVRLLAQEAMMTLMAMHQEDPRIRASIYATARLALDAWTEPSVSHSASLDPRGSYDADECWEHLPRFVDLDWLMEGGPDQANSLYLVAPDTEFKRLAPVLGGLLGDLREQVHAQDVAGRAMPKPLLFVVDEAGQLELQWLPEEVSTIAGLGGMFVTVWQSKAQINHRYGTLADAVLGGHRSKIVFAGTDDPTTLDLVTKIGGTEHVGQRGWSVDPGGGRRSISEHAQRQDLLAPHVVRQMRPKEAVLLHGTLPPAHIRLVEWWRDPTLARLASPGSDEEPGITARLGATCPMSGVSSELGDAGVEVAAAEESSAHLPPPGRRSAPPSPAPSGPPTVGRRRQRRARSDAELPFEQLVPEPDVGRGAESDGRTVVVNKVAAKCASCGRHLSPGAGQVRPYGAGERVVCEPVCPETSPRSPAA